MNGFKLDQREHIYHWFIFTYYVLKENILCENMFNQGFDCFIPKVKVLVNNKNREMNLFPGYGFGYIPSSKLSSLKYTKGIKTVLRQGKGYASISKTEISNLMLHCENALTDPIIYKPKLGDTVKIDKWAFKNNLAQVISLDGKDRIEVMLSFLPREIILDSNLKNITQV